MDVSTAEMIGLLVVGVGAGWLGAVVGIGGGIVIVPLLVLAFGFDIRVAVATSLIAVVATSTSAGSAYVGQGRANMRLGMTLEVATTVGGVTGGLLAVLISPSLLSGLFAVMMVVTAATVARGRGEDLAEEPSSDLEPAAVGGSMPAEPVGWEEPGTLAGAFYDEHQGKLVSYRATNLPVGSAVSLLAGAVSGLLGVGGGFLKVPAMTEGMKVPIKVAAATSNFMIGVTAIASLFVYFARGYVHPYAAAPVALGVVVGAMGGAATSSKVSPRTLRWILVVVLVVVAAQMALKAAGVDLGR
jgi:uncharacterized membrane protein YfcA